MYKKEVQRYVKQYSKFIAELLANDFWICMDVILSTDGKNVEDREIWVKKSSGISGERLNWLLKLAKKYKHELFAISTPIYPGRELIFKFKEKRG